MTTALQLINETQRMLLGSTKEEKNTLAQAVSDTTSTTIYFTYDLKGIQEGAVIEVDTELMRVMAVDTTAKTATVLRGNQDSTAATHSSGAHVTVNPKFSRDAIFDAMNDTLDDLTGEGLFKMTTLELTYTANIAGYDLTGLTDVIDVYRVSYKEANAEKFWPTLDRHLWELRRDAETDDFASSFAIIVQGGGTPGLQLRVEVKVPLVRLTATSDDVTTTGGLLQSAEALLKYGSAMRLVYWRETMRNAFEAQGDSRRAEEVPAGGNIGAARGWQAIYDRALYNALADQARRWPE